MTLPIIAIAGIFKNEAIYVIEWLAHHRLLGVERFFIADNGSDDGTTELLAALETLGYVNLLPFPGVEGTPPQLPAYEALLERHGGEADWIAFVDADEFIWPASADIKLGEVVRELGADDTVGAIALNWACYGSAHQVQYKARPVVERFNMRARQDFEENFHYKSIVRPSAFQAFPNPHFCILKSGFEYVKADGTRLVDHPVRGKGLSAEVMWAPIRLNHYVVKSREEFFLKKSPKGRATVVGGKKTEQYFLSHDRNDEIERAGSDYLFDLYSEMLRIEDGLREVGFDVLGIWPQSGAGAIESTFSVDAYGPKVTKLANLKAARGVIDSVNVEANYLVVRGWALSEDGLPAQDITVVVDGVHIPVWELFRVARKDVQKHFPNADLDAGFRVMINVESLPEQGARFDVLANAGGGIESPLSKGKDLAIDWNKVAKSKATARQDRIAQSSPEIPPKPCMPEACATLFTEGLKEAQIFVEYGAGGSTMEAVCSGVKCVVTVESDQLWLESVKRKLQQREACSARHLPIWVDIGRTKVWGYPVSDAGWRSYWRYAMAPWQVCWKEGLQPDLVLIDGRFRVACFLATLIHAKAGATVLFDDYFDRPYYQKVEGLLPPTRAVERMAVFVVPSERPAVEVIVPMLLEAVNDCR